MQKSAIVLLAFFLIGIGGCAHITSDTSQFYIAQHYLPLPPAERDSANAADLIQVGSDGDCASGPVKARPRAHGERFAAQVLAGMMLRVTQTSYAATRHDIAVPLVSTWQWVVPASSVSDPRNACADGPGVVPGWSRGDLLYVRSLLSGAQFPRGPDSDLDKIGAIYFEEAMAAACGKAARSSIGFECAEAAFLNQFVFGLSLNLRAQGQDQSGEPQSQPPPGPPFEPEVPADVISKTGAPDKGPSGYGQWYAGLSGFRFPADLFKGGLQATQCRGPFADGGIPGPPAPPRSAPVCKFAQASLEWSAPTQSMRMPGATLQKVSQLSLLRSGDPLFIFQPQNYLYPLDTGNGKRCGGDTACMLQNRMMQGFTEIALLIPIELNHGERRWVPIGMSVAAFENSNGLVVEQIRRSPYWLPTNLSFLNGKTRAAKELVGTRRRIELSFAAVDAQPGLGGGVEIRASKADLLFAPGDIVFTRRP